MSWTASVLEDALVASQISPYLSGKTQSAVMHSAEVTMKDRENSIQSTVIVQKCQQNDVSLPATVGIEHHGIIGDMYSAALVNDEGTIDFFCFPQFDSPSVLAHLLGDDRSSAFSLHPTTGSFKTKQAYIPDTNVLVTRFLSEGAVAEITDFMPIRAATEAHGIMRRVSVLHGEIEFNVRCAVGFGYGQCGHSLRSTSGGILFTPCIEELPPMVLLGDVPLQIDEVDVTATFRLLKGESAHFFFGACPGAAEPLDLAPWVSRELAVTCRYWRQWNNRSIYTGRWREQVSRSALVLKLLTSASHGSLIAAPTFGLPELLGGGRNWDYRYVWLRDASFTLYALCRLGYVEESRQFTGWLKDRVNWNGAQGPLEVMYRLDGGLVPTETELTSWKGYQASKPVLIGNGAKCQLQLDVYGELFDALYLASKYGDGIPYEDWNGMKAVIEWLSKHWRDADEGIWEVRGGRREFLHSRLMCWVAFDRAIRLGSKRSLSGPFEAMEVSRDEITADIHDNFWSEEVGAFVQYKGATLVDASALLMPLVRFISPNDPRWLSTLAVIERDLMVDCFVKRYATDAGVDGLDGSEGCFTACSFWMVEALARSHQLEKAQMLLERLLSHANALGLYSEELSSTGAALGNFPQALTHLALISAATYLDRRLQKHQSETWA